jgi:hypothetical protein
VLDSSGLKITDINPNTNPADLAALFLDIKETAYAEVPGGSPPATRLGGNIAADILAQEGGLFYLGFVGPNPNPLQPTTVLGNMSLSITPHLVTPVPAAVWLFGSAMLGVFGVGARRRTRMSRHANAPVV